MTFIISQGVLPNGMRPCVEEYIQLLLTFNAKRLSYYEPTDYLGFSFDREIDAKKFCAYINKIAKQKNFYCE